MFQFVLSIGIENGTENTRLSWIKQEFQEFKNSFEVMILRLDINDLRLDMESLKTLTRDFRN